MKANKTHRTDSTIDHRPAWLDLIQSITGLLLVLFLWTHMLLVSSILLGHDAMYVVAKFFEGQYIFGTSYPALVSLIAAAILVLVVVHALLALRKFPANYHQYKIFHRHMLLIKHSDTTLWYLQALTGFALLFLTTIHIYSIMTHPAEIGPYASADRVWTGVMWPLYLVLLLIVELHAGVGLYRLAIKWGWPRGSDARRTRKKLQQLKWLLTSFFIILGLCTLLAYIKIGIEHQNNAGERYQPKSVQSYLQTDDSVEMVISYEFLNQENAVPNTQSTSWGRLSTRFAHEAGFWITKGSGELRLCK